jgi:riboflavin synthase
MFTGLVQAVGTLGEQTSNSIWVEFGEAWSGDPIELGESIAVNGCCITAVETHLSRVRFDLSEETLSRTTFGNLKLGTKLNLERALRLSDRLGGHIVQGHVDCVGSITARISAEGSELFDFKVPDEFEDLLVDKGSVCIDGISLTVIEPQANWFRCAIIPHTLENTNLLGRKAGDLVNVEFDILAKTLKRLSEPYLNSN